MVTARRELRGPSTTARSQPHWALRLGLRRALSPTFPAGALVFFIPLRGWPRIRRGAFRPARAAWAALRLLPASRISFSDIPVRGDDGAWAIGATDDAAAVELPDPMAPTALIESRVDWVCGVLSLRHFRLARWCFLSLCGWWPRIRRGAFRCSGRLGGAAAAADVADFFLVIFRFGATMELGRLERPTMRPLWSYRVDGADSPDRKPR